MNCLTRNTTYYKIRRSKNTYLSCRPTNYNKLVLQAKGPKQRLLFIRPVLRSILLLLEFFLGAMCAHVMIDSTIVYKKIKWDYSQRLAALNFSQLCIYRCEHQTDKPSKHGGVLLELTKNTSLD